MERITKIYSIPQSPKRVAVFASYSKYNVIEEYVVYYIRELRKVVDTIVFVADNYTTEQELKKIEDYVCFASCYHHGGYDFGSYKIGYLWALRYGLLNNAEELVFLNDSCYGPLYSLQNVFETMKTRTCDFWGMVESHEIVHHIQSFFYVFKKSVFKSTEFSNFVCSFRSLDDFWDYVNMYERRFTDLLEQAGFKSDVYLKFDESTKLRCAYDSGNGNITLYPLLQARNGMPLIKRKALNGGFGADLRESTLELLEYINSVNKTLYGIILRDLEKNDVKTEDKWLQLKDIVAGAQVVSFDVFDTLIARPYVKPTDLFRHIEQQCNVPGYADARTKAERNARRAHPELDDITLDHIYQSIESKFKSLKEVELDYERKMLFAKKDGKAIYDEAVRQNKHIIATSDMYLPSSFIKDILAEKGYTGISEVFVSNEANACKGNGKLFSHVLKSLGIQPSEMVHIGDNPIADKEAPEKLGIRAVFRMSDKDKVISSPALNRLLHLSEDQSLASSFTFGVIAQYKAYNSDHSVFHDFGYELGGPLALGYVHHIHETAKEKGIDGLLFVSRDGYVLYEIYKKLYPQDEIKAYYIQASRKLILRNRCDNDDPVYMEKIYQMISEECLGGIYIPESDYYKYEAQVKEWCAQNAAAYQKYADSLGITGKRMMSVDMTSNNYTSLHSLKTVFGDRVCCGMFSYTQGKKCEYPVYTFAKTHWTVDNVSCIKLQEELITAPEFSVYKITPEGKFMYKDYLPAEKERIERYRHIYNGIMHYADDHIRLANGNVLYMSFEDWARLKNYFVDSYNYGTQLLLKNILHEDGDGVVYWNLYDALFNEGKEGTASSENYKVEADKLKKKYRKHIRAIRKLTIGLSIETAAVIVLLLLLIFS